MNALTALGCAATIIAVTFVAGCRTGEPGATSDAKAVIVEAQGTVQMRPSGSGTWAQAKPGQRLAANSSLRTGAQSTATLHIQPGGPHIFLKPNSRLELARLAVHSGGATATILELPEGDAVVNNDSSRRGSTIEIRTPRGSARIPSKR